MSLPRTEKEKAQAARTEQLAGPAENLVSTPCPECGVRFVMLARLKAEGWLLRCTACGWNGNGELK